MIRRDDPAGVESKGTGPLFSSRIRGTDLAPIDLPRLNTACGATLDVAKDGVSRTAYELQDAVKQRHNLHVPIDSLKRYLRLAKEFGYTKRKDNRGGGVFAYRLELSA